MQPETSTEPPRPAPPVTAPSFDCATRVPTGYSHPCTPSKEEMTEASPEPESSSVRTAVSTAQRSWEEQAARKPAAAARSSTSESHPTPAPQDVGAGWK